MSVLGFAAALAALSMVACFFVLRHAFQRSVGTGFLVLLVPSYILWYAFSQFEHERKGAILALFLGAGVAAVLLYSVAGGLMPKVAYPPVLP